MIQLFLNNTEVFPERDTSIKMIRENPILTESGSYTLDVNLPLSITENVKFFGSLHRIEVSKQYQRYDCELRTNGRPLLVGTAVITKVTDQAVTIQILAGNSNVRFWNNAENDYIDEYDFNTMADGQDIVDARMWDFYNGSFSKDVTFNDGPDSGQMFFTYWLKTQQGLDRNTPEGYPGYFRGSMGEFCFCRVFDRSIDEEMQLKLPIFGNGQRILCFNDRNDGRSDILQMYFNCIQPNLLWVIGKVCEKRGYTFDAGVLKDTKAEEIYIASARQTLKIADALPHWTVKEFFEEVQKLFNVTIYFDDTTKTATMKGNETFDGMVTISDVVEELEVTVDEDEKKVIDNVKYRSWDDDFGILLPDEVKKKQHIMLKGDVPAWQEVDSYPESVKADVVFVDKYGRRFLWRRNAWHDKDKATEVDFYGPVSINEKDATELKIRPAKTVEKRYRDSYFEKRTPCTEPFYEDEDWIVVKYYYHYEQVLDMENQWGGYTKTDGDLYSKLVYGEEISDPEKEDEMQIFFYSHNAKTLALQSWYKYEKWRVKRGTYEGEIKVSDADYDRGAFWMIPVSDPHHGRELRYTPETYGYSMALKHNDEDHWNIGSRFNLRTEYDTKVEHKFSFLSPTLPDVRSKFLIRGKLFACKKIEVNVSDDGIDPLLLGYFVEIKS